MTIDPNILNDLITIALSVAANGLTSLIARSGHKVNELIVGKEFLKQQQIEKTALKPLLHTAITEVAEHGEWDASKGEEIASLFLSTPEVEELVRQIYSTKVLEDKRPNDLPSIRKTFLALLTDYFAAYSPDLVPKADQLVNAANPLFEALLEACDLLLNSAIDNGILAAHEAKEAFRYNLLHSQIEAIQKELELLSAPLQMDRKAILAFEKQYREQVGQRHGRITPPNLEAAQPHPIDELYVWPHFIAVQEELKKDAFLSRIYRAVLLGNPGAGKSTLARKLCHDLANNYSQRLCAGRKELTPILVILRDYGIEKKERRCSIVEFVEAEAKAKYQLEASPHKAFQYLLLTGRAMVIFDGLDELLDTNYRQEIRSDVESFCHLYPSVPVVVTSREIGYEQAPLDERIFQVFRLKEFNDEQVNDYVKKWFAVADMEELTEKQRQQRAEAFLTESQVIPDLRSNPLMLALLCGIYREENYIPQYRPDVYEKCALMLFLRWDKSRGLFAPPLAEEHVRPLMEYLASWIYGNEQLRGGVTEEELASKATAYLHDRLYEDIYKARSIAEDFIKFCTGRAWVFTDTGTKKEGEKLYQFVHTTFLEYFAASYLVSTCWTPGELLSALSPRIAKREWDVLAQLAFQLQSKKNVGAADYLLKSLVTQSREKTDDEGWNLLSFAARCLQFIVPRPPVRRFVTEAIVERCLAREKVLLEGAKHQGIGSSYPLDTEVLFMSLLDAAPENHTTIVDTLRELLVGRINNDDDSEALIALEIPIYLAWKWRDPNEDLYRSLSNQIIDACSVKVEALYPKSLLLCLHSIWFREKCVSDLITWFGFKSIFQESRSTIFSRFSIGSLYEAMVALLSGGIMSIHGALRKTMLIVLRDLGDVLLSYSPPWVTYASIVTSLNRVYLDFLREWNGEFEDWDCNLLFGAFGISAMSVEVTKINDREHDVLPERVVNLKELLKNLSHSDFYLLASARDKPELIDKVQTELDKHQFIFVQQHFIWRWIRKEFNLVADTAVAVEPH